MPRPDVVGTAADKWRQDTQSAQSDRSARALRARDEVNAAPHSLAGHTSLPLWRSCDDFGCDSARQ
eukprot:6039993-Prymnesium_polylepis.1